MDPQKKKTALLAGATGLVGSHILRLLTADVSIAEVRVLVRRPLPDAGTGPRVRELIADFDHLDKHREWFQVDLVFSALGTTIGKAGSQAAFRKVDFNYPLEIARLARSAGAMQFLFVSALGADARSFVFYNKVKGELEEAIKDLGYPSVTIARPSLLLGERRERRFGEELSKKFAWLLPPAWAGVQAAQVATALVQASHEARPGVRILENREMRKIQGDS
jgi:uncharacterized protein YbjT (DUF2867 family)